MTVKKPTNRTREGRPRAAATRENVSQVAVQVKPLKLSDPAARHDVAALKREITSSQKHAIAFLREVGIATPTGRLSKKFGGS